MASQQRASSSSALPPSSGTLTPTSSSRLQRRALHETLRRSSRSSFRGGEFPEEDSNSLFPSLVKQSQRMSLGSTTTHSTHNKLQFSNEMYGRECELAMLKDCLSLNVKGLVLISGKSGVGKTSLAHALVASKEQVLTMSGVFLASAQNEPYSGIRQAVGELCGEILAWSIHLDPEVQAKYLLLKEDLMQQLLKEERQNLMLIFPDLEEILTSEDADDHDVDSTVSPQHHSVQVTQERKNQFHHIFQKFLWIIANNFQQQGQKLLIILDDLQFADQDSLTVIQTIMLTEFDQKQSTGSDDDTKNQNGASSYTNNLMIIGTSRPEGLPRSNSGEEQTLLAKMLQILEAKRQHSSDLLVTYVGIGNLSVENVAEMLHDLLKANGPNILGLAQLCHRKTHGNAFYLKRYLRMLHQSLLLDYNTETMTWTWDEDAIEENTQATDNVVEDLLRESLDTVPEPVSEMLQLAACLGACLDVPTLDLIWEQYQTRNQQEKIEEFPNEQKLGKEGKHSGHFDMDPDLERPRNNQHSDHFDVEDAKPEKIQGADSNPIALSDLLDCAEAKGFLIRKQKRKLLWAHSKVLEASLDYIPEEKRSQVQSSIGDILVAKLKPPELDRAIFVVVDLLNAGQQTGRFTDDPLFLALLNQRAAEKSIALAAFDCATNYASKAIESLPENRWSPQYTQSTLHLFSLAAELECMAGHYLAAEERCNEVLAQSHISVKDKARANVVLVQRLYLEEKLQEALDLCLRVLEGLGCSFPKSTIAKGLASAVGLLKIKMTAKSPHFLQEADNLPVVTDPTRIQVFRLLERLAVLSYYLKDPLLLPATLRAYRWTWRYGISAAAASNFASIGIVFAAFASDFETAKIFADFALALLEKTEDKTIAACVYLRVWGGVLHYVSPIHSTLKPLQEGYERGMATGDFIRGVHCLNIYLQAALSSGRSLSVLEPECEFYVSRMRGLKQQLHVSFASCLWQTVLNLVGSTDDDEDIGFQSAAILDLEAMKDEYGIEFKNNLHQAYFNTFQLQLFVLFDRHAEAAELALSNDAITKASPGCALCYGDNLFRGVAFFDTARRKQQSKYKVHAKRMLAKLKSWCKKGNPNVQHYEALLLAEDAAMKKKHKVACEQYEIAVAMASRSGFIQDSALASERYGDYLLQVCESDKSDAVYRVEEAIRLYKEWGAHAKARQMLKKHSCLLKVSEKVTPIQAM